MLSFEAMLQALPRKLSLADIALVAYTRFAHQAGLDLGKHPHVKAWVRRVEGDLKLEHLP